MSLYCRSQDCAQKDLCSRYRMGRRFNFQDAPGIWYVNARGEEYGYKNPNDQDICNQYNNYELFAK